MVLMFAIGYPFLVALLRSMLIWRMDPIYAHLAGHARVVTSAPDFMLYFLPGILAFFFLPIRSRFNLTFSVALLSFVYIVFMVWPVYLFSMNCYCSLKGPCFL